METIVEIATELSTWLKDFFQAVIDWPYFWPVIIAIILLLVIRSLLCKKSKIINLSTQSEGKVSVVRSALVDLIENTCSNIAPNSRPRVCLFEKKGTLHLKIKIKIFADQHIEKTAAAIQQQVTYLLQNTLGLENIGSINILITGFTKSPIKRTPEISLDSENQH